MTVTLRPLTRDNLGTCVDLTLHPEQEATEPVAKRGYRIDAVELGAAVAARKLSAYPGVAIHVGDFERWPVAASAGERETASR